MGVLTAEASYLQRFGLTVNPQNVLGVRTVVLQEAHDLEKMLNAERERALLPPLGGDPVSFDMSAAFNEVTLQLLVRAKEHVASLFELCDELAATAREYGRVDADIAASFGSGSPRTAAGTVPPLLRQVTGMSATAARPPARSIAEILGGGRS